MAIIIEHKFKNRLSTSDDETQIRIIIIGTFNPGLPIETQLNETEKRQFDEIKNTMKFKEFNLIKNFYDRSRNRFWKILDIINNESFYNNDFKKIKEDGMKFYKKKNMDINKTFDKQENFCKTQGIFITDLVKSIEPISFCNIYDNFPDTIIEKSNPKWNTGEILAMIRKYNPTKVLVNFDYESKSIPGLSGQISEIKKEFPDLHLKRILSPSGSAGNSYEKLFNDWKQHITLI